MVLANVEWTGALCTILALACAVQLLITGILSFGIPHFLSFSKTQMATSVGMVAGCVTLPTVIRIKTSKISPNMDRIYGYTIWYQRLAIGVCSTLHMIAVFFTIYGLATTDDFEKEFLSLIHEYHTKVKSKALTDNIQWNLQCCGASSYKDWYDVDWGGYNFKQTQVLKKGIADLLNEDTDSFPDLATSRNDVVPFSCCKRKITAACIHVNLVQLGIKTINDNGCSKKLTFVVDLMLKLECLSYSSCLTIELLLLVILCKTNNSVGSEEVTFKRLNLNRPKSWSHFANTPEDVPTIIPTMETVNQIKVQRTFSEPQKIRLI